MPDLTVRDVVIKDEAALMAALRAYTGTTPSARAIMTRVATQIDTGLYTDFHTGERRVLAQCWTEAMVAANALPFGGRWVKQEYDMFRMWLAIAQGRAPRPNMSDTISRCEAALAELRKGALS